MVAAKKLVASLLEDIYINEDNNINDVAGFFLWGRYISDNGLFIASIKDSKNILSFFIDEERLDKVNTDLDFAKLAVEFGYTILWKVRNDVYAAGLIPINISPKAMRRIYSLFGVMETSQVTYYNPENWTNPSSLYAAEVFYGRLPDSGRKKYSRDVLYKDQDAALAKGIENPVGLATGAWKLNLGLTCRMDPTTSKVQVIEVADNSLGDRAGFQKGDLLVAFGPFVSRDGIRIEGDTITSLNDLRDIVNQAARNQELVFNVLRGGRRLELTVHV